MRGRLQKQGQSARRPYDPVGVANLKNEEASGQAEADSFGAVTAAGATRSSSPETPRSALASAPWRVPVGAAGPDLRKRGAPQVPASPATVPDSGRSLQLT